MSLSFCCSKRLRCRLEGKFNLDTKHFSYICSNNRIRFGPLHPELHSLVTRLCWSCIVWYQDCTVAAIREERVAALQGLRLYTVNSMDIGSRGSFISVGS